MFAVFLCILLRLRGQLTSPCNYSLRIYTLDDPAVGWLEPKRPGGKRVKIFVTYCCSLGIGFCDSNWLYGCAFIPHIHTPRNTMASIQDENRVVPIHSVFLSLCVCVFFQFESVYFMACYACYFVILFRLCSNFFLLLVIATICHSCSRSQEDSTVVVEGWMVRFGSVRVVCVYFYPQCGF